MKNIPRRCSLLRPMSGANVYNRAKVSLLLFIPSLQLVVLSIQQTIFRQRESFVFEFQRKSLVWKAAHIWHVRRYTSDNSIKKF